MEAVLNRILGELQHVNQKLENIDNRLDKVEQRMDKLGQRMDTLEGRMDKLEQRVDILEVGQKELHQMVHAIRNNQLESRAVIDSVQYDIADMKGGLKTLCENMVTKKDLRFYDMKIGEHDREIFTMKQQ
ncbi:hypothetical protein ACKE5C_17300 [Aneurinibacillus thermoaerophilus]|uniref:t-SNARE coiled-coil homology domain-containing protein n=1 Tax=Aneurinibacillus thermoaerophilus TaxID=143495 RepID=A0ABX8YAJ9_ANETH|nr:hypothetical protein [Aneurinibacillus thermoaerophilus]QYY42532.1 hypothetical protein K3F53_17110 [Aneurinibacillus thermoaerophilus]